MIDLKITREIADSETLLNLFFDIVELNFGRFDTQNIKQKGLTFTFTLIKNDNDTGN